MSMEALRDLYVDELKDVYYAEKQILKSMPKMVKAASTEELKEALERHFEETRVQLERLEEIFDQLGLAKRGKKCEGMVGILSEGDEIMEKDAEPIVKDAGLIASAQKVEHYEIASYGTLVSYAKLLGDDEIAALLEETLAEEKKADQTLTEIAEESINVEALEKEQPGEEE